MKKSKITITEYFIIFSLSLTLASLIFILIFSSNSTKNLAIIDNFSDLLNGKSIFARKDYFSKLTSAGFKIDENFVFSGDLNDYSEQENDFLINFQEFDSMYYKNETVLAVKNNTYYIYYKEELIGQTDLSVSICENSQFICIIKDNLPYFYDLNEDFLIDNPILISDIYRENIEDCILFSYPDKVFKIVNIKTNLIGFASKDEILLQPSLRACNDFVNDCTQGTTQQNKPVYLRLIDGKIKITYLNESLYNTSILDFNYEYALYYDYNYNEYGVINQDFTIIVEPQFKSPHLKVINGYVLDYQQNSFYNLTQNEYTLSFKSISFFDNFYICQKQNQKYTVIDLNLNPLIDESNDICYYKHSKQMLVYYQDSYISLNYS